MTETVQCGVTGGTPGANSNDYVLFDSTLAFSPGTLRVRGINRAEFTIKNSQAGTLKAYYSQDKGVTWSQYDSQSVSASTSTAIGGPFDYLIDAFPDWKLVWTNGGSAQATWLPALSLIRGLRASGV